MHSVAEQIDLGVGTVERRRYIWHEVTEEPCLYIWIYVVTILEIRKLCVVQYIYLFICLLQVIALHIYINL